MLGGDCALRSGERGGVLGGARTGAEWMIGTTGAAVLLGCATDVGIELRRDCLARLPAAVAAEGLGNRPSGLAIGLLGPFCVRMRNSGSAAPLERSLLAAVGLERGARRDLGSRGAFREEPTATGAVAVESAALELLGMMMEGVEEWTGRERERRTSDD